MIHEQIIDIVATNIGQQNGINIDNNFVSAIDKSDHYPNCAIIMNLTPGGKKRSRQTRQIWDKKAMNAENTIKFQGICKQKLGTLSKHVHQNKHRFKQENAEAFVSGITAKTLDTLDNVGHHTFGKISVKSGDKERISDEALNEVRKYRKYVHGNRHIMKIVEKRLKKKWKSLSENRGKTMRQLVEENRDEIIEIIGIDGLNTYKKCIKARNHKQYVCKIENRKTRDKKNRKTIEEAQTKNWFEGLKKITGKSQQAQDTEIKRIIKPKYASKEIPPELNITHDMFTHGSQETCGVVGEYMCTVGSSENPAHNLAFPCDRQKAREFDKPCDLKEKIWNDTIPPAQQTA